MAFSNFNTILESLYAQGTIFWVYQSHQIAIQKFLLTRKRNDFVEFCVFQRKLFRLFHNTVLILCYDKNGLVSLIMTTFKVTPYLCEKIQ